MGDHQGRVTGGVPAGGKIIEVTNVDFALRHFLWPLLREARSRSFVAIGACCEGPLLAEVRADGFAVVPLPPMRGVSPVALWRAYRALLALFRRERPDAVHAHMPISGVLARLAARHAGVPRIAVTCHGFLFNQPGAWPRRLLGLITEWCAGKITDVFLTVSREEAADARRLGIHANPIAIGNGRDPARFRPDPAARARLRAGLGVPEGRVVVVITARLVRHKGFPELLAAMRTVDAELWIVGDRLPSDHGEDLEPLFAGAGLGDRLRRLGYRTDIPAVLAAADIFTLPSHFEGLPMSIIEAMFCALPVVATDIRGSRELVTDGETGLLVPRSDIPALAAALQRLATAPALRHTMGQAGLARARQSYVEATIMQRTIDLIAGPVQPGG